MANRSRIHAGGAVVLRGARDAREVLVVHRPAYDDWALPKGKVEPDEYLAVTAVREVREETGYRIRLLRPLPQVEYEVAGRPKTVHWWLATVAGDQVPGRHDAEADRVEWWPVEKAVRRLSYANEVGVLTQAVRLPTDHPWLVVRHAKAMSRRHWQGPDADRRLTERGRRQAKALVGLLSAFGVGELASSSSTRCVLTLTPYSRALILPIRSLPGLSEESAEADPAGVARTMVELRDISMRSELPLVVCGHRPVLPLMFDFLGVQPERTLKPAEVVLIYPTDKDQPNRAAHIAPRL